MADVSAQRADWQVGLGVLSQAVLLVFLAFLGGFLVAVVAGNLIVGTGLVARDSMPGRVALVAFQFVGFGLGVTAFLSVYDEWRLVRDHLRVPSLRDLVWLVGGVVSILVAAAAVGQILQFLGVETAQNQVIIEGQRNPTYFLYMIPVSLLLVGPFEELVFRVGAQGLLRRAFSAPVAIVAASAMFGVVHIIALGGGGSRLSYIAVAAVLGVVLGVIYERTQNLVVPAGVHGVYNSVLFLVQYATATGMVG
jgi:hypothetical protein